MKTDIWNPWHLGIKLWTHLCIHSQVNCLSGIMIYLCYFLYEIENIKSNCWCFYLIEIQIDIRKMCISAHQTQKVANIMSHVLNKACCDVKYNLRIDSYAYHKYKFLLKLIAIWVMPCLTQRLHWISCLTDNKGNLFEKKNCLLKNAKMYTHLMKVYMCY